MRVAIVGGGAAGLVTAYLLSGAHELTLFESGSRLGGHVCTLNGNLSGASLAADVFLDAGVVEFDERHFPTLARLLDQLGIERRPVPGTTSLFLQDGRRFQSPANITRAGGSLLQRLAATEHLLPLALEKHHFDHGTDGLSVEDLREDPVGDYLGEGIYSVWLRMLLMYAYSIPYPETSRIPAALAVPMLRDFTNSARWTAIQGGTYAYLDRILEGLDATIVLDAKIGEISRSSGAVQIRLEGSGEASDFDAVVLAAPPDQVLALLADPTPDESRWFGGWRANRIHTVVHTDTGLYERRGADYYSEFDLFETAEGGGGYNAYLNRLSGLPDDRPPHYFLAYGLDHEIDPACVVHEQAHHTPFYTVEALRHRQAVRKAQGQRQTFHAGAWLGEGLHEGAVASAVEVSRLLGGRLL